ncbi:MAG: hypothetical protein LUI02_03175 [Clostridiales bacterium]|nr:hypothetical protein [Clostridiales bacterium]
MEDETQIKETEAGPLMAMFLKLPYGDQREVIGFTKALDMMSPEKAGDGKGKTKASSRRDEA